MDKSMVACFFLTHSVDRPTSYAAKKSFTRFGHTVFFSISAIAWYGPTCLEGFRF